MQPVYEHSFFQNIALNATAFNTVGLPFVARSVLFLNMTRAFIFIGYNINYPENELNQTFQHVIAPYSIASYPAPAEGTTLATEISYYADYPPLAPSLAPASVPQEQFIFYAFDFDRDTFVHDFRGAAGDFSPYPGSIVYYDSIAIPANVTAGVAIQAAKSPFTPTWNKDDTAFLLLAVGDGNASQCIVKIGNTLTPHTPAPGMVRAVLGSVITVPPGVAPVPDPLSVEIDGLGVTGEQCFCEAVPTSTIVGGTPGSIYIEVIKI